jgi:endonuclease/exonuclease/phosphatase family metal-dependent hydrolase
MRAIASRLAELAPEVVALQEVWTGEARAILLDGARRAGLDHAWHPRAAIGGSGMLLLSRHPIESARFERFCLPWVPPRVDHPDYYGGKGVLTARLATPDGPVAVVATHLHAPYRSDVPHQYRAYRVGQIVELAAALRGLDVPAVVLGDFNFRDTDPEYRILSALAGVRDAAAEIGQPVPTVHRGNAYRGAHATEKRIDYVFLRDGGGRGLEPRAVRRVFDDAWEIDGRPASYSDHAGLLADLVLNGSPSAPGPADLRAFDLAAHLLDQGRRRAYRRQHADRLAAGVGWGAALIACAGARVRPVSRRRVLRAAVQAAGIAALTPGVTYTLLSEVFAPGEVRVFDQLSARLFDVRADRFPGSAA